MVRGAEVLLEPNLVGNLDELGFELSAQPSGRAGHDRRRTILRSDVPVDAIV